MLSLPKHLYRFDKLIMRFQQGPFVKNKYLPTEQATADTYPDFLTSDKPTYAFPSH